MTKKKTALFILGIGILMLCLIMNVNLYKENRVYEKYLSEKVVNHIALISQSALYNLGVLQDIVESRKLTNVQAEELEKGFRDIVIEIQSVSTMGTEIGILEDYNYNTIVEINSSYADYLGLTKESNNIELTDNQLSNFDKMKTLMKDYHDVVNDSLEITGEIGGKGLPSQYWDLYRNKGINDDYWVNLLQGYSKVTTSSNRLN